MGAMLKGMTLPSNIAAKPTTCFILLNVGKIHSNLSNVFLEDKLQNLPLERSHLQTKEILFWSCGQVRNCPNDVGFDNSNYYYVISSITPRHFQKKYHKFHFKRKDAA